MVVSINPLNNSKTIYLRRTIKLPFAPFIGLMTSALQYPIEEIHWDIESQEFACHISMNESLSDNGISDLKELIARCDDSWIRTSSDDA
jgi:hypothetical protein